MFMKLHTLLQEEYSGEDLQIIACPSMEQVCVFVYFINTYHTEECFKLSVYQLLDLILISQTASQ